MQIVKPIDIEDALRVDLSEIVANVRIFAPPAPDDLGARCVQVMCVGGAKQTAVSFEYSVRIDCWESTEAAAIALANDVAGAVNALIFGEPQSGRHYVTAEINATPYINPDPNRPTLPRASFRAEIGIRGIPIF